MPTDQRAGVAVLGGTRFVGEAVTRALLAGGHRVTLFNRGIARDDFGLRVERRRIDRKRAGALAAAVGAAEEFDAVIDVTAYDAADSAEAVAAFAGRCRRFVHISTGQVYLIRRDYRAPAREQDVGPPFLPKPDSEPDLGQWRYGMDKWACEEVLIAAHRERAFPAIRVRLPVVMGPRDPTGRLARTVVAVREGRAIRARDGGRNVVRHVFVDDVAAAVVRLAGPDARGADAGASLVGEAVNLAQDETPTVADLVALIAELLGRPAPEIVDDADAPDDESPFSGRWCSVLDTARAKALLAWAPTPWRNAVAASIGALVV